MHQLTQSINNFLLQYLQPFSVRILYFLVTLTFFLVLYLSYRTMVAAKRLKRDETSKLVYLKYALPQRFQI